MSKVHFVVEGLAMAAVLTASAFAQAQEAESEAAPAAEAAAPAAPAEAAPAATPAPAAAPASGGGVPDDGRFRFGVSGGIGFFTAADEAGSAEVSCTYYGTDLRFGYQVNNMIGVYAQPTLGYYSANGSGGLAAGGLLGTSVVVDATI